MGQYILRRLLLSIPTLVLGSVLNFLLLRIIPGDVVMARLSESCYVTPELLASQRHELGLDRNPVIQYFSWGSGLIRGDFGKSLWTSESVLPAIVGRMGIS